MNRLSPGQPFLVVQQGIMIKRAVFGSEPCGALATDGKKALGKIALGLFTQVMQALADRGGHGAGHALACQFSKLMDEPASFRIFYVQTGRNSGRLFSHSANNTPLRLADGGSGDRTRATYSKRARGHSIFYLYIDRRP